MITQAEQIQTLIEDLDRAEKAGLVVKGNGYTIDENHVGEFLIADTTVTRGVFTKLLGYLKLTYPDIYFRQTSRYIHYIPKRL